MAKKPTHDAAREAVLKSRTALVLDHPFFGSLALRLKIVADPSCDALWTDGESLGYNPEYVQSITHAELKGVMAHEVLHCTNGHVWRKGARNHDKWNVAADLSINPIILGAGMVLPQGALDGTPYKGKSAEEIYTLLPDGQGGGDPDGQGGSGSGNQGSGSGQNQDDGDDGSNGGQSNKPASFGEVRDAPNADTTDELAAQWHQSTLQAAQAAKSMGQLPAGLERLIEEIKHPPQDWRALLRRFVQSSMADDYSWKMPNTRFIFAGLYMPALKSESLPPIVVAVDTSGSIDEATLSAFAAEINAIAEEAQPEAVHVVYCDAGINGERRFERGDLITLENMGGGGTDFRPVFEWVEQEGIIPSCLIYLTDLEGTFPAAPPGYPVLWGATSRWEAPWGETVRVDGFR